MVGVSMNPRVSSMLTVGKHGSLSGGQIRGNRSSYGWFGPRPSRNNSASRLIECFSSNKTVVENGKAS